MKDCGDCVAPGFEFQARTVAVSSDDLRHDRYGGQAHETYADALDRCGWTAPVIAIDIAVVKFWQVNRLAPPLQNVWSSFADSCDNPPNPAIKAFVQKVKRVHAKGCAGHCGYELAFDAATGIIDVGAHNPPVNIGVEADTWLEQQ
jgi:hypothetical protein